MTTYRCPKCFQYDMVKVTFALPQRGVMHIYAHLESYTPKDMKGFVVGTHYTMCVNGQPY